MRRHETRAWRAGVGTDAGARWQDHLIEQTVAHGSKVLDLGCGHGGLLERLLRSRAVRGQGIEVDEEAVFACVARGVPVFHGDIEEALPGFPDASFDYVVLEQTLQTLRRPLWALGEMLRVGRRGIVTFPNFAHWRVRLDLLLSGRMPVTRRLPYEWHDSPNIHLLTIADFADWADERGVAVLEAWALGADGRPHALAPRDALTADEAMFVVACDSSS